MTTIHTGWEITNAFISSLSNLMDWWVLGITLELWPLAGLYLYGVQIDAGEVWNQLLIGWKVSATDRVQAWDISQLSVSVSHNLAQGRGGISIFNLWTPPMDKANQYSFVKYYICYSWSMVHFFSFFYSF